MILRDDKKRSLTHFDQLILSKVVHSRDVREKSFVGTSSDAHKMCMLLQN